VAGLILNGQDTTQYQRNPGNFHSAGWDPVVAVWKLICRPATAVGDRFTSVLRIRLSFRTQLLKVTFRVSSARPFDCRSVMTLDFDSFVSETGAVSILRILQSVIARDGESVPSNGRRGARSKSDHAD